MKMKEVPEERDLCMSVCVSVMMDYGRAGNKEKYREKEEKWIIIDEVVVVVVLLFLLSFSL